MPHLTTKYVRATKTNLAVTMVYVDNILVGQYRRISKVYGIKANKYMACKVNGENCNTVTLDQAIEFISSK